MKQQFFGLRKAPINRLLKKIKMEYTSTKAHLQLELEKLKLENEQLEIELEQKEKALVDQVSDDAIWEYGKERLLKVVNYLEQQKNIEVEELQKKFHKKRAEISKQIEGADVEIQSLTKVFSDIHDQFSLKFNQPFETAFQLEAAASTETNMEDKEALSLSNRQEAQESPAIEELPSRQERIQNNEERVVAVSSHGTKNDGFWGDLEELNNSFFNESPTTMNSFFRVEDEFMEKVIQQEEKVEALSEDNSKRAAMEEDRQNHISQDTNPSSDTLLEQIESIKTHYIVGKVAGADLVDLEGNKIVAKNSLITRDVVELANRKGKLAELIVNMKLTGGLG